MNRIHLLVILLLAVVAIPFAAADTIQLTFNGANIATVSLTAVSGGVKVSITADPGYSIKTQGGDILFNTGVVTLNSSSISSLTVDGFTPAYKFDTNQTRAGVTFAYDLTNFNKGNLPNGYTSAFNVSFIVSGVSVADLKNGWSIHFCTGHTTNCGQPTNFTNGAGQLTVPEPGTLSLLGTGLFGIAGFMRRRFLS